MDYHSLREETWEEGEASGKLPLLTHSHLPFPLRATRILSEGQKPEEESLEQASPV